MYKISLTELLCLVLLITLGCTGGDHAHNTGIRKDAQQTTYRRPYGDHAPWNIPVRNLPEHPESAMFADRLWNKGCNSPGNFNLTFDEYTYPVYYTANATNSYPIETTWETNINGKTIPWNPEWQPATGTDAQIILLDSARGYEWNLWQVSFQNNKVDATNGNLIQEGERSGDGSNPGNYWLKENGFIPSRGIGIQYLAMLVRPGEIEQGIIEHALSMPVRNTDGKIFVPPATKLEHPDHPSGGIPEGMRFAIRISDDEIDNWLRYLPRELPEQTRRAARIIAIALRDYGWFITDSSGAAHLQFEDRATAGEEWDKLGLNEIKIGDKEYPRDLLDGLIPIDRIYALVPSDQYP